MQQELQNNLTIDLLNYMNDYLLKKGIIIKDDYDKIKYKINTKQ